MIGGGAVDEYRRRLENSQPQLLSPEQVATACGLSRRAVYRAIERGELRASRLCSRIRIRPADVDVWVDDNQIEPLSPVTRPLRPAPSRQSDRSTLRGSRRVAKIAANRARPSDGLEPSTPSLPWSLTEVRRWAERCRKSLEYTVRPAVEIPNRRGCFAGVFHRWTQDGRTPGQPRLAGRELRATGISHGASGGHDAMLAPAARSALESMVTVSSSGRSGRRHLVAQLAYGRRPS